MNIGLIRRVEPVNSIPRTKHSTQDSNERRRRQLLLTYGYQAPKAESKPAISHTIQQDIVQISEEGKRRAAARACQPKK